MSYEQTDKLPIGAGPLVIEALDWNGRPVRYEFQVDSRFGYIGSHPAVEVTTSQGDQIIDGGHGPMRIVPDAPEYQLELRLRLALIEGRSVYRTTNMGVEEKP